VQRGLYAIGEEIARGGMGRILAARDRKLGRNIAVKELLSTNPGLEARFEREMRISARLQHPAIISVHDAGRWPSGEAFYTMKHVEGRALDDVIEETTTLPERLALLPNVLAVADAIAYAHAEHVIHRDLKPANVLAGAFGETVVIDWGLAKDLYDGELESEVDAPTTTEGEAGLTVVGEVMGTPAYMPLEQARGAAVDERADVYALGAMLYHLLSGQIPCADTNPTSAQELLHAVLSGAPTALSRVEANVPSDLLTSTALGI
jgi:serine/threonine protein kinase